MFEKKSSSDIAKNMPYDKERVLAQVIDQSITKHRKKTKLLMIVIWRK